MNHLNTRETYDGLPVTDYHGYGAIDFYAVDEHQGTLDGTLRNLPRVPIKAAARHIW